MLSLASSRIIAVEEAADVHGIRLFDVKESPSPVKLHAPNFRVQFAAFLSKLDIIVSIATDMLDEELQGSIFIGPVPVLTRVQCSAMQLRVLPSSSAVQNKTEVTEEEEEDEIWVLWSDSVLSRTLSTSLKTRLYPMPSALAKWHDFVLFPTHLTPLHYLAREREAEFTPWLVVAISPRLLASFHFLPALSRAHGGKTLLAVSATSIFTSFVSSLAKKYLIRNGEEMEEELTLCHEFADEHREFHRISRGTNLFAVSDSLGRVLVFNASSFQVVKMLKGFRLAEMGFVQLAHNVEEEEELLAVYSSQSRGERVELWEMDGERTFRPLAFALLPSSSARQPLRMASNCTGTQAALFNDEYFIPINGSFLHQTRRRSSNGAACEQVTAAISEIKQGGSGALETDSLLRNMGLEEWMDHCGDLGLDFFMQTFAHRADWSDALKRIAPICKLVSKLPPPSQACASTELHPIRLWAATAAKQEEEETATWFPPSDLDRFILCYLQFGAKNEFVAKFCFNALLGGDIFAVREVYDLLIMGEEEEDDYLRWLVEWWLASRVECAHAAWKNATLSTVSLVKFLHLAFSAARGGEKLAMELVEKCARGRIQLARACLFAYAMQCSEAETRLALLYARALQLCSGSDKQSQGQDEELTCLNLNSRDFLWQRCFQFALLAAQSDEAHPVLQKRDESEDWHNPSCYTLDYALFHPVLFLEEEERDSFRLDLVLQLLAGERATTGLFNTCHRILATEMEGRWWSSSSSQAAAEARPRHATCDKLWNVCVEHCQRLEGNDEDLLLLLLFLAKRSRAEGEEEDGDSLTACRSSLVEAIRLANQARGFTKRAELINALLHHATDFDYFQDKPHQELLIELLGVAAQTWEEDEELRALGRRIGITSADRVCHLLATGHAFRALDQRALECFDKFQDEQDKSACASDLLLKIIKLRCVLYLKEAERNEHFPAALARWNPKTTSWLTSSAALEAATRAKANGLQLSTIPSTRLVLSKLLPFLPAPPRVSGSNATKAASSSSSHHSRCLELLAFTEETSLLEL